MNKEIVNALEQLLKVIKSSETYLEYEKAEKHWNNSKESQELLNDFLDARNTLQIFQQGKFPGIGEQKEKTQKLYEQVGKDANIQNWLDAQDKYQLFIYDQAQFLADGLGHDFATNPSGGCCC